MIYYDQGSTQLDMNMCNDLGDTPLHLAAKWGYGQFVHLFFSLLYKKIRGDRYQHERWPCGTEIYSIIPNLRIDLNDRSSVIIHIVYFTKNIRTGNKSCRYAFQLIFSHVRWQIMIQSVTFKRTSHFNAWCHNVTITSQSDVVLTTPGYSSCDYCWHELVLINRFDLV